VLRTGAVRARSFDFYMVVVRGRSSLSAAYYLSLSLPRALPDGIHLAFPEEFILGAVGKRTRTLELVGQSALTMLGWADDTMPVAQR